MSSFVSSHIFRPFKKFWCYITQLRPRRVYQRSTISFLLVEATPCYKRVYQPTLGWYGPLLSPVSAGRNSTRRQASSMSHEYRATYLGEANSDSVAPKGWGSKSSHPTSSNIRSITGCKGPQIRATNLRVRTTTVREHQKT